jgi:cytidylate kinase
MSRQDAPLKPALDAIIIDTTTMDVEMMVKTALSHCAS